MFGTALLRGCATLWLFGALIACGAAGGDDDGNVPGGGNADGGSGGVPPAQTRAIPPIAFEDLNVRPGTSSGQIVLTFTAPPATGAASRYDVRVHVPHLSPDPASSSHYAGNAPTWPNAHTPKAPGDAEQMTLTGLEPGQTVQVSLRGIYDMGPGPFAYGVGVRVPGPLHPPAPANAIPVSVPRTLDAPGYYLLTQDVSAPGTAFTITVQDVTLDLGGHTITYGAAPGNERYGVASEFLTEPGTITVRNGTIRQGAGSGASCPGIHVRAGYNLRFSGLTVECHGDNTSAIEVFDRPRGTLRIDHCRVSTSTAVVGDRHFPGVAAIWLGAITESVEIDHNEITATPQWGIKLQGNASNGHAWIHHNKVVGTKSKVANAYMVGVHKPKTDVWENELVGESRGIHIDGDDNFGNDCHVHDNLVRAQDFPNAEFPVHWTHGIKVESARNAQVHHNAVLAVGDATHTEALALDVSLGTATGVAIFDNRFHATSDYGPFLAKAFSWSGGADTAPASITVRHNVFRATDQMIHRGWAALNGGTFRDNAWERDAAKGPGHDVVFERIDVSDIWPSPGHKIVDPVTSEDTTRLTQWANPAAYDTERWATVGVIVVDAAGAPIPAATVRLRDRTNTQVASGSTDAQGRAAAIVLLKRITKGPVTDDRGPFTLEVSAAQGTFSGSQAITGRTAIQVVLSAASTATADVTAPAPPEGVIVHALSATRLRARWTPAQDESGVVGYQVFVNDVLCAYTDVAQAIVAGLTPGATHEVRVRAIDAGGNMSPLTSITPLALPADDRGP